MKYSEHSIYESLANYGLTDYKIRSLLEAMAQIDQLFPQTPASDFVAEYADVGPFIDSDFRARQAQLILALVDGKVKEIHKATFIDNIFLKLEDLRKEVESLKKTKADTKLRY